MKVTDPVAAYVTVYLITILMFFVYVKHEVQTLTVNQDKYTYAGMIEQQDNGVKLYIPIYRRQTK